jgi:hypothetical protein
MDLGVAQNRSSGEGGLTQVYGFIYQISSQSLDMSAGLADISGKFSQI